MPIARDDVAHLARLARLALAEDELDHLAPQLDEIIAAVDCPVLGMFGETDHLISIEDIRRFRDCLERHGKSYDIHDYRDAPHGWLNDTMPGRYRRAQAEAAWAHQLAFLEQVLAPGYDRSTRMQHYTADIAVDYDFSRNVRHE